MPCFIICLPSLISQKKWCLTAFMFSMREAVVPATTLWTDICCYTQTFSLFLWNTAHTAIPTERDNQRQSAWLYKALTKAYRRLCKTHILMIRIFPFYSFLWQMLDIKTLKATHHLFEIHTHAWDDWQAIIFSSSNTYYKYI